MGGVSKKRSPVTSCLRPAGWLVSPRSQVVRDPSGGNYLEAILVAIRAAGHHMEAAQRAVGAADQASNVGWKWQFVKTSHREHASAFSALETAERCVANLGPPEDLPAPLDQLPSRLSAMRERLGAMLTRIEETEKRAASKPLGTA